MTHYLINSPILSSYGEWTFSGPISVIQAQEWLNAMGFVSAIGHHDSARLLSELLNADIEMNRIQITMQPGDEALVFRLLQRPAEGKILNLKELVNAPFELALLTRVK